MHTHIFVYLTIYLSIYLSIYLYIYMYIFFSFLYTYICIYMYIYIYTRDPRMQLPQSRFSEGVIICSSAGSSGSITGGREDNLYASPPPRRVGGRARHLPPELERYHRRQRAHLTGQERESC